MVNINLTFLIKYIAVILIVLRSFCTYAANPISLGLLEQNLNAIIANRKKSIYSMNKSNNSLNSGILTGDFDKSLQGWQGENSSSKFEEYISQLKNDKNINNSMHTLVEQLPNNSYLMSLVKGEYYSQEKGSNIVGAGISPQSILLSTAVLSQINASEKTNKKLLKSVQTQLGSNWFDGLKASTRDQLLRSISLQLSVNNLMNYQKIQLQYLNALLKIASLMDDGKISSQLDKIADNQLLLKEKLNNINYK
ncbi:hypothetical protein [Piscirickettsia litoralis]|uniref:Uncharacterized protein n=1 Tax=Piscirickettsia litoralis TaxID=1891921 RepID=A0ABX3A4U7_9GAMM|nr:hypothetical protein [Piscirickettsia litoralis]ODN43887.1 hypothetical protein BGC07_14565 [Piscirickettsia litoralis]